MLNQHHPTEVFYMEHRSSRARRHMGSTPPSARRESEEPKLFRSILKSVLITIGIAACLITVASLALSFTPDPNALIPPVALGVCAATALLGGFLASRIHGSAALICGLLNGGIVMALMLLLSPLFRSYSSAYSAVISALLRATFLACSVAGAFLASHLASRKKPKRR